MHTVTHGGNVTNRLSTTDELAAMRARADEATEGPWGHWPEAGDIEIFKATKEEPDCPALAPGTTSSEWILAAWIRPRLGPGGQIYEATEGRPGGDEPDAEFIAHARGDMPRLLDAVEAVLAMHEPVSRPLVNGGTFDECSYCVDPQDNTWRLDHPCPTVQAITSALGATR